MVMLATSASKTRNRSNRIHTNATRKFRNQAAAVKRDAWNLAETAGAVAREQLDPLRDIVTEKPLQSLLIVAGVGMFLGLLFGRR